MKFMQFLYQKFDELHVFAQRYFHFYLIINILQTTTTCTKEKYKQMKTNILHYFAFTDYQHVTRALWHIVTPSTFREGKGLGRLHTIFTFYPLLSRQITTL
jgi:hypothetical protein